ncbi:MAG: hypothetical protein ACI89X_001917 [Planctomycetota bacterium]|jgi:hypothetical protein
MLAFVLSLAAAVPPQEAPRAPAQVSAPTFAAWRDHIAPLPAEDRWLQIDWHDSVSAGVQAATEQQRPMLLWLMNGHPLGCT